MGFHNIEASVKDATVFDSSIMDQADVVIADVPCSGLGVIGRKKDIKYNMTLEKIKSLVPLQREILEKAACYVKPGCSDLQYLYDYQRRKYRKYCLVYFKLPI